jgi:hypothetical protein
MDLSNSVHQYEIFLRINFAFAPLVAFSIASFSIHYPQKNVNFGVYKEIIFLFPVAAISISSLFGIYCKVTGVSSVEVTDIYFIYAASLVLYFILVAGSVLIKKYYCSTGIERLRLKYIIIGYLITIIVELGESIYQNISGTMAVEISRITTLASIAFPIMTMYALFRYRLFDIGIVIKRGFIKGVSLIIIFGLYLLFVLSLKDTIDLKTESQQTTFFVISTFLVIVTIEPIRKLLHSVVDKIFESNSIKQEESQKKIRLTLRSQQTVENLQLSISKITQELFNVESSQFLDKSASYLQDNKETSQYLKSTGKILIPEELPYRFEEEERFFSIHQELEKTDYSAFVPLGQNDIFMGCIVLGKRKNHAAYTVEEVREMKQLQDQFTEALWNARLYQHAIARIKI